MFVNYFADPHRPTALNLTVARVILGGCALWKVVSFDWTELAEWPTFLFEQHAHRYFLPTPSLLGLVPWLEAGLVVSLLSFMGGYRPALSAFVSAGLIAYMLSLQVVVTNHRTLLLAAQLLLLYGLFSLNWNPTGDSVASARRPMWFLKWALVTMALGYFFSGYGKIVRGPLPDWVSSEHMNRVIQMEALRHLDGVPAAGTLLIATPWLGAVAGWSTILLEAGFIWAVVFKLPVWPSMVGLAVMHTAIFLTQRLLFFDLNLLLLMFCPWDTFWERLKALLRV